MMMLLAKAEDRKSQTSSVQEVKCEDRSSVARESFARQQVGASRRVEQVTGQRSFNENRRIYDCFCLILFHDFGY
jgi:hypothetical protein